jgi:alginate O-acetyltransferase complex protein AlgI
MRFNSLIYPLFLAIVVVGLRLLPARLRFGFLLLASYLFYASWHWPYLGLLVGCAALNHFGAVWITQAADRSRRGKIVVAANIALLALFKYLDWLVVSASSLATLLGVSNVWQPPHWVLPLGISFYVFESISYIVDVMRKREKIHSFWSLQLFIAFFPKLIAGPILRAKELLPQIESAAGVGVRGDFIRGLTQIVIGMFIKVVLADSLSQDVDNAFSVDARTLGGTDVYLAAIAFGLQIYFDFSGYSRIAYGSALLCGIKLVDNFDHPYTARSPVDFWNRWHMSLSRWIRDYLFYPLMRRQTTKLALTRAAILSMTLCGVWHGAGWTYALWGLYHGLLIAGYHALRGGTAPPAAPSIWRSGLESLVTFGLVMLGWIFFRAVDLTQACELWKHALLPWEYRQRALSGTFYLQTALLTVAVWSAPAACRLWTRATACDPDASSLRRYGLAAVDGVALGAAVTLCLIYLRGQTAFIYFQF